MDPSGSGQLQQADHVINLVPDKIGSKEMKARVGEELKISA